jgi:taurine dioxygenase
MMLETRPLSDAIGAEILGVDLAGEIFEELFAEIRQAWVTHKVLLFRGQDIDHPTQTAFARRFGDIQVVRSATHLVGESQEVMHVSNRPVDGKPGILPDGEMMFHTDQCYYEVPSRLTMLFAIAIPSSGGNTLFLNTMAAYAALPAGTKDRLAGLMGHNIYDYDGSPTLRAAGHSDDAPQFDHPIVIRHPETGAPCLYANRLMTDHILGLEREESDALLLELFERAENEDFIYEHVWQPGDLILWDNLATMHARTDFDPAETRTLRRATVAGERPQPYEALT